MCLSINSSSTNLLHEIDTETSDDGLMSNHDKTCQDCFVTYLQDQVMYHYSGIVKLTFVKGYRVYCKHN